MSAKQQVETLFEQQKKHTNVKIVQITTHPILEVDYEGNWTNRGKVRILGLGDDGKVYYLADSRWYLQD